MQYRFLALAVPSLAISSLFVLPLAAPQTAPSASTVSASTAIAASAPTPVPALIPYSGSALDAQGRPLADSAAMTFLIYKDEQGGQPLFAETQAVAVDATGHYKVQLGASLSSGIPIDLFSSGEARWIEVQIAGQPSSPRVLLVSVPYALKAADAATLGGLPASAFALAGSKTAVAATSGVTPDAASTVTTTGGTTGYLPQFSGAATIVDSPIFVTTAGNVGVGTTAPGENFVVEGTTKLVGTTKLDGATTAAAAILLQSAAVATAKAGVSSQQLQLQASAFNTTAGEAAPQTFAWQALPVNNDTATASGVLDLLFATGTNALTATGLSVASNGIVSFAAGQTFPGTGAGTIKGVTAGTALTGGGTTGTVTLNVDTTKVPLLASANSFAANQSIAGTLTTTGSISTAKQLDSTVATGTAPLAVTSTTVVPNLNVSLLNGFASSAFAKVGAANTFTGIQSFSQVGIGTTTPRSLLELSATASKALGPVLTLTNTAGGLGAESTLDLNTLLPSATGTYNPAVRIAAQDVDKDSDNLLFQFNIPGAQNNGLQTNMVIQPNGEVGIGTSGTLTTALLQITNNVDQPAGIFPFATYSQLGTQSGEFSTYYGANSNFGVSFYADGGASSSPIGAGIAILGVTDNNVAGYFIDSSPNFEPLFAENDDGSGYLFSVYNGGTEASCAIDNNANLSCSGTLSGSNVTAAKHTVETYAMQAAENWYEDAGSGTLEHGSTRVNLDPAFAELVNANVEYHVFLTPKGDCKGLYVADETGAGFEVRELGSGKSSISFDYRIMVKRKGYEQVRMADITDKLKERADARNSRKARSATGGARPSGTAMLAPHQSVGGSRTLAQPPEPTHAAPSITTPSHGVQLKPISQSASK